MKGMRLSINMGILLALVWGNCAYGQVPEYVYRASRNMPQAESQDFATLAEAEAYIRTEPATPIGNAFLRKVRSLALNDSAVLLEYRVPVRAYESYEGGFYEGHMSGNHTDCFGYKCRSEEEMVAASMRAYPLLGAYTPVLRGAYLSPPFTMWSGGGRTARVTMNAVHYSGETIPNERQIVATASTGHSYTYRINRVDDYRCPELFTATNNDFGEPRKGIWPLICINNAAGQVMVRLKQRAPACPDAAPSTPAPDDRIGNPCAADFGNKEYREGDFAWDGFDFRRAYNSVADFPSSSGLGDNWSHSFSDRLMFDNAGKATFWVRPDGYVERFYEVESGKGVYFSPTTPNLALSVPAKTSMDPVSGIWKLSRPGQTTVWFDASGRLIRKQTPGNQVDFAYCAGTELGTDECPSSDLIRRVTNARGRSLEFVYAVMPGAERQPRLVRVKSDAQVSMEYQYDSQGRLTAAWHDGVLGAGRRYLYGEPAFLCLNAAGGMVAGCNPALYPNHLTGIEDESGVRFATYTYDGKGRVTASEHAGGKGRVTLDYVSPTETRTTLPTGATKTFRYSNEELKKLLGSTTTGDAGTSTQSASIDYDSRWRVAYNAISGGARTSFAYTGLNLTSRIEGLSETGATTSLTRSVQTDWNTNYNEPAERRILGNAGVVLSRHRWTYNDRGQPIVAVAVDSGSGEERATVMTYCEQADIDAGLCPLRGLVLSVDGARTDVADITRYSYYPADAAGCSAPPANCHYRKGDLWKVTDALGQALEILRYDSAGRVLSSKDSNAVVTDVEYSTRGWLLAVKVRGVNDSSEVDDLITRMEYWPTGLIKKSTLPDGAWISYAYDAAQRLASVADNDGNSIHYTLDNDGNRIKEDTKNSGSDLKRTLSRIYNSLGQLHASRDASQNATIYRYDTRGNLDRVTDALGRVTDHSYDPLNRLVRTLQDVGGLGVETKTEYDALDRLIKVTDPKGLDTTYAYNGFGEQTRLSSPDTGVSTFTYDSAGNRKTETDARNVTRTYTYDALNRLTGVAYPTTSLNVGYEYDGQPTVCAVGETFAKRRLSLITDASGSTQYCYDRFGRIVRKVQTTNGKVFAVRYAYTLAGQLSSVTYPDGAVVSYQRDAQGRVSQVDTKRAAVGATTEALLSQAAYHPFGPVSGWTYGNGRTLARPVDLDYRTTAIGDPSVGGLSVGFGFDVAGNLNQLTPAGSSTPLLKYDYDGLDRLTHLRDGPSNTPIETYSYDATGNRLSLTQASGTQTYVYPATSHRLAQVGNSGLRGYDASGNTTDIDANSFIYNDAGRMSQLKQSGVLKMTYLYNGLGEQVRKYTGADNRYMVYDESGHWLGEYDSNGATIQQAIWMDDLPVGVLAGGGAQQKLHYVEPDHLGTPRVVIDPVRNVAVWNWDLKGEAFGNSAPNQDPDLDGTAFVFDMRFPGQRFDSFTGLNYNYFRDYDSATGRYVQSDPLGLIAGVSSYSYVNSDPIRYVDPYGLDRYVGGGAGHVWAAVDMPSGVVARLDYGAANHTGNESSAVALVKSAYTAGKADISFYPDIDAAARGEKYYRIPGDDSDDAATFGRMLRVLRQPPHYNIVNNNCGDVSMDVVGGVGILGPTPSQKMSELGNRCAAGNCLLPALPPLPMGEKK